MAKYEISPDGKTLKYVNEYDEEMIVPEGIQKIAKEAFRKMHAYGGRKMKKVVLPEGVKTIGVAAFSKCDSIENITLPETLTKIEDEAFIGCKGLTTISLPSKLKSIGAWAFSGCPLQKIEFAASPKLTEIGERAFVGVALSVISLPKGIKKIGSWAFSKCVNLKSVTLPDGIETFDKYEVFEDCTALESINIPASLVDLGYQAFKGCTSLKNITVDPANPAYVMKDGILMTKDLTKQIFPIV